MALEFKREQDFEVPFVNLHRGLRAGQRITLKDG